MKGYKLINPLSLFEQEIEEKSFAYPTAKVRLTKALVTLPDILKYNGETEQKSIVLGGIGIGVVSEIDTNLFGLEKGNRVFVEGSIEGDNESTNQHENTLFAGEDYDGFLRDFISSPTEKIYALPESVSDIQALFIEHISLAIDIIDKLDIKKGDYVSIIGGNNLGNIIAQLLMYYQAVPILLCDYQDNYENAKKSGVYYAFNKDDNWNKEVFNITSGRYTNKVIYVSDCNIPVAKAFSVASSGAIVAFTGAFFKNNTFSFSQAIKKQLEIKCINYGFGHSSAAINLIANKAINFDNLVIENGKYSEIPAIFSRLNDELSEKSIINETVIDLLK